MDSKVLEKIYKIGLKFLEPISLDQTYQLIPEEATKLLEGDWSGLYLVQEGILSRVSTFPSSSGISNLYEPRKNGFTSQAYLKQKTFVIHKKAIDFAHPE